MKVAASPQSINRAMPEVGIQVTSHQSPVTPNPQSLIPSYSSLLSNFKGELCPHDLTTLPLAFIAQ